MTGVTSELARVHTGAERRAGAGEDDAADTVVAREPGERVSDLDADTIGDNTLFAVQGIFIP